MRKSVLLCLLIPASMILAAAGSGASALFADETPKVLNGIDVLRRQGFAPLSGKRVGLVTNHTGLAADGETTIDLLHNSGNCRLVALFSPEHGIRGVKEGAFDSSVDARTGLPIYSLYGDTRRPTEEMLNGLDALVFDIQDVGVRFYTYSTTLGYCLEEAARAKIPLYVLDRPNPIGGDRVEGPMLDADKTSFVGYMPLPVRHGMTVGELAGYFNSANRIGADLRVIRMSGWQRSYFFDATGQLWVNPSPNMRSLLEAILYPGVCLLEGSNISVGRGTDRPFEIVGAPWIEPRRLAAELERAGLPGIKFVPVSFTPDASTYAGSECGGLNLLLTDREKFQAVLTGLTLISTIYRLYPDKLEIDRILPLLGNAATLEALKKGESPADALRAGNSELAKFLAERRKALIYDGSPRKEGEN